MIRAATTADHTAIRGLLLDANLPVEDLDGSDIAFLVAATPAGIVGAIGLQACGTAGLLRSLVVLPAQRGDGIGVALVHALEQRAQRQGIHQLVLLTQTAEQFFARLGYAPVARGDVPMALQTTAEFSALCPASATCMRKLLSQT